MRGDKGDKASRAAPAARGDEGNIGVAVLAVGALLAAGTVVGPSVVKQIMAANNAQSATATRSGFEMAMRRLAAQADTTGGYAPVPAAALPASGTRGLPDGAAGTGGGLVPASAGTQQTDQWGRYLVYCTWTSTGATADIAANAAFALISAGANGRAETTCAQAQAGGRGGDDMVKRALVGDALAFASHWDRVDDNRIQFGGGVPALSRIGVGTSDPRATLDVAGIGRVTNALMVGDTSGSPTTTYTLDVTGTANISSDLSVGGDTNILGGLDVAGPTHLRSSLRVDGDTTVGGDLLVEGDTHIDGRLTVTSPDPIDLGELRLTTPLAIAYGGTAANNAADARANLGATAVGDALFTAATAAAARAALGSTATGSGVLTAADAAAGRSALALGSVATQDANAVALTGGSASGLALSGTFTGGSSAALGTGASPLASVVAASGGFTSLAATSAIFGSLNGTLTGNVTGNLTGNSSGVHTGNVVGNVTGDLTGNSAGTHTGPVVGNVTGNLTGNVAGNVSLANGSAASPSLNFVNSPTTGVFRPGGDAIAWALSGAEAMRLTSDARLRVAPDTLATNARLTLYESRTSGTAQVVRYTTPSNANWIVEIDAALADPTWKLRTGGGEDLMFSPAAVDKMLVGSDRVTVNPGSSGVATLWTRARDLVVEHGDPGTGGTSADGGISIVTRSNGVGFLAFSNELSASAGYVGYQHTADTDPATGVTWPGRLRFGSNSIDAMRVFTDGSVAVGGYPVTGYKFTVTGAGWFWDNLRTNKNMQIDGTLAAVGAATFSSAATFNSTTTFTAAMATRNINANGNIAATGTVSGNGAYINSSDARLKKGVEDIGGADALAKVAALRGVGYEFRGADERDILKDAELPGGRQVGFIAQEVRDVVPEAVVERDGVLGVAYSMVVPYLAEAVEELAGLVRGVEAAVRGLAAEVSGALARLAAHDKELAALKSENAALRADLDALRAEVRAAVGR